MTTISSKAAAHFARNQETKAAAAQRKLDRVIAHVEACNTAAEQALERRRSRMRVHALRNDTARLEAIERRETAALADATRAYAEAIERTTGIPVAYSMPANDNAAVAKAA